MQGTVSKVIAMKGFGFIRGSDGHEYFFHMSSLQATSQRFDELREGTPVSFETLQAPKGPRAIDVQTL